LLTTGLAALCLLALLLTLGRQQLRCPEPLLQLGFFKYPIFSAIAFVSFIYGMGLWGSAFLLPLYLQQAVGLSVWDTGMVMLPSGLFLCLTLPFGGRMADGIPARYVVSLGLLSLSCSFLLLGLGVGHDSFIAIAALIVLSRGLGLGLMIPSLDATATRALPAEEMAEAVALMNFIRQLGGALSPTLLSMLLYWRIQANTTLVDDPLAATQAGYSEALLGLAVMFGLSLLAAWQLPRRRFSH
jgi:MFS family permease